MKKLWQDKLRQIEPYVPGEQPTGNHLIKLNANENPYPPSPRVALALHSFDANRLRLYPDANAMKLKEALAAREKIEVSQIFIGNGSDDVLALAFQSFFCSDKPILFPDITYSFYPVWCSLFHTPYKVVPLMDNFKINPRDYDCANGGVILPNPNAPTGASEPLSFIEDILQHNQDCIVIVDEAYVDFGANSSIPLIAKYENLLVVQTFSKSRSLAGLRLGVAFGHESLIATLEAVKNSYNSYTIDSIAMEAGIASIEDEAYFRATCARIIATRQRTIKELTSLGFTVLPSNSNFVLASPPCASAKTLFEALRARNIYVRYFNLPRINHYLRITIGTDAEMDALFAALHTLL